MKSPNVDVNWFQFVTSVGVFAGPRPRARRTRRRPCRRPRSDATRPPPPRRRRRATDSSACVAPSAADGSRRSRRSHPRGAPNKVRPGAREGAARGARTGSAPCPRACPPTGGGRSRAASDDRARDPRRRPAAREAGQAATPSTARRSTSCSTRRPRTGSPGGAARPSTSTCTTSARTSSGACRPGRTSAAPTGPVTGRRQPPRRFRLAYLVTAWTQRPEDEHRLLSSLLACLLRNPMLKPDDLGGALAEADLPVYIEVGQPASAGALAGRRLVGARRRAQAVARPGRHGARSCVDPERLRRAAGHRRARRSGSSTGGGRRGGRQRPAGAAAAAGARARRRPSPTCRPARAPRTSRAGRRHARGCAAGVPSSRRAPVTTAPAAERRRLPGRDGRRSRRPRDRAADPSLAHLCGRLALVEAPRPRRRRAPPRRRTPTRTTASAACTSPTSRSTGCSPRPSGGAAGARPEADERDGAALARRSRRDADAAEAARRGPPAPRARPGVRRSTPSTSSCCWSPSRPTSTRGSSGCTATSTTTSRGGGRARASRSSCAARRRASDGGAGPRRGSARSAPLVAGGLLLVEDATGRSSPGRCASRPRHRPPARRRRAGPDRRAAARDVRSRSTSATWRSLARALAAGRAARLRPRAAGRVRALARLRRRSRAARAPVVALDLGRLGARPTTRGRSRPRRPARRGSAAPALVVGPVEALVERGRGRRPGVRRAAPAR